MTPGCWQRDTRKYGLRNLALCAACAAALHGKVYKRHPPDAERGPSPRRNLTNKKSVTWEPQEHRYLAGDGMKRAPAGNA